MNLAILINEFVRCNICNLCVTKSVISLEMNNIIGKLIKPAKLTGRLVVALFLMILVIPVLIFQLAKG